MNHDNHEAHIFKCPIDGCNKDALNKAIGLTSIDGGEPQLCRNVFCLEHKNQWIPIDKASKANKQLDHEFEFYKGTHLEDLYKQILQKKYEEYQKIQSDKEQK